MATPPDLSPDTRRKLVAALGMMGSDHPGERDNAARLADRMVRGAGLTWDRVVASPRREAHPEPPPPPRDPPPAGWRELVIRCAAYPQWLTAWERSFLAGLSRRACLSVKQRASLGRIVRKLRGQGVSI